VSRAEAIEFARRGAVANLLKPAGMTSHDVVAHCRKLLHRVKTGHTGTLDPSACGVLVLLFGPATRLADFQGDETKEYVAELRLGATTATDDAEGEVLKRVDASHLTLEEVQDAAKALEGPQEMAVPLYSAQKQAGKPLYKRARAGEAVKPRVKHVEIYRFEVLDFQPGEMALVRARIECSKGTYVRSLARSLGEALGVGGHLGVLVRTRAGVFVLEEALTLEEFEELIAAGDCERAFHSPSALLSHLPKVVVEPRYARVLAHGQPLSARQVASPLPVKYGQLVRIEIPSGRLVALGRAAPTEGGLGLAPAKVFITQEEVLE